MTSYQGLINGSLCLARQQGERAYGADEKAMLDAVVPHLGIAIALAESLSAIASQARTDPLTGLLNRRGFFSEGARQLGAWARAGKSSALLLVDCDSFFAINERLGQIKGDEYLRALGDALAKERGEAGVAARLAGDEFAILTSCDSATDVRATVDRVRAAFQALSKKHALRNDATASIGVAFVEAESGVSFDDVLARANGALATAKREGGNRAVTAKTGEKVVSC
jgi:diguanylate cyclase (GGDEF)-like protein